MSSTKKRLKSMTAHGRATSIGPLGQFVVELFSVNRRYLEINNSFSSEFLWLEADLKKWIASQISRGAITVKLSVQFNQATPLTIKPNLALARQLKAAWEEMASSLHLNLENSFKLEMLKDVEQIILYESDPKLEKEFRQALFPVVQEALRELVHMKEIEGGALSLDILARLKLIASAVEEIAQLAPGASDRFRLELQKRLEELLPGRIENEERLLREVCVYAEKIDIAEELTRLKSHIKQFTELLENPPISVGKTLDFLIQEMNREINTISSKSSQLKVSQLVITVKTELERIREQIQNVE